MSYRDDLSALMDRASALERELIELRRCVLPPQPSAGGEAAPAPAPDLCQCEDLLHNIERQTKFTVQSIHTVARTLERMTATYAELRAQVRDLERSLERLRDNQQSPAQSADRRAMPTLFQVTTQCLITAGKEVERVGVACPRCAAEGKVVEMVRTNHVYELTAGEKPLACVSVLCPTCLMVGALPEAVVKQATR